MVGKPAAKQQEVIPRIERYWLPSALRQSGLLLCNTYCFFAVMRCFLGGFCDGGVAGKMEAAKLVESHFGQSRLQNNTLYLINVICV